MTLAITSKSYPLSQVEDYTDTRLAQKISQVTGVGLVTISGGQKPAVRIQANPTQLSAYGISLEDIRASLQQASVNLGQRQFRRRAPGLRNQCQRPAFEQQGLSVAGRRISQWRAGGFVRCGNRD
jgi:multidrug efflux pump subunit AcrB